MCRSGFQAAFKSRLGDIGGVNRKETHPWISDSSSLVSFPNPPAITYLSEFPESPSGFFFPLGIFCCIQWERLDGMCLFCLNWSWNPMSTFKIAYSLISNQLIGNQVAQSASNICSLSHMNLFQE